MAFVRDGFVRHKDDEEEGRGMPGKKIYHPTTWVVKAHRSCGKVQAFNVYFPKEMVGKIVRFKVEVLGSVHDLEGVE